MTDEEKQDLINEIVKNLEVNVDFGRRSNCYSKTIEVKVKLSYKGELISESASDISDGDSY